MTTTLTTRTRSGLERSNPGDRASAVAELGAAAEQGLLRHLVVRDLGGLETTPLGWFRAGVELARSEASFGWVVTQGAAQLGWIGAGADTEWA